MPTRIPKTAAPVALLGLVLAVSVAGCPCAQAVTEASPSLRWWLFSNFGASRICPELLKRGVPLRLEDRAAAIGRFFPAQCSHSVDDSRQTVTVNFAGTGYGYMMPAKRVGFSCTGSVEYRPDFQIAGDDVYVWGKLTRVVQPPNFQLGYIENPIVDVAANLPPFGSIANFLGNQVVQGEMTRGFTVVHNEDKGDDFTLGLIMPPTKPHHPFDVSGSDRFTFANETIDVHANQRDYVGPFEIQSGQSLYLVLSVDGPPVDVMIVDKRTGDFWRDAYQTGKPMGPPPGPVYAGAPLYPGHQDNRRHPLAPGSYYVVIDNTQSAGTVAPPVTILNPLGDAVARVSYLAQAGD